MERNFIISEGLAQAILNYLTLQPYREVAALVAGLQQLQPVPAPIGPPTLEDIRDPQFLRKEEEPHAESHPGKGSVPKNRARN